MIKKKFPWSVIVHLEEKNDGAAWSVKNLRKELNRYVSARESAEATSSNSNLDKSKFGKDQLKVKLI